MSSVSNLFTNANWNETLQIIFDEIKESEERQAGMEKLKHYVTFQLQVLQGDRFSCFMKDLHEHTQELLRGPTVDEILSGLYTLDKLFDIEYDMNDGPFVNDWSTCLFQCLHSSNDSAVISSTAACLGRFARLFNGTLTRDFIASEMNSALDSVQVQGANERKRQTAILILAELIHHVPTLINVQHVEGFLQVMWDSLHDPRSSIREGTVKVLKWCLSFLRGRAEYSSVTYERIYQPAAQFLRSNKNPEVIHGSMLVLIEILANSDPNMISTFEEICELVFSFKDHRSSTIRKTVIQCIPQLAQHDPELFSKGYLSISSVYLIQTMKREPDMVVHVGYLAKALGEKILPVFDDILAVTLEMLHDKPTISKEMLSYITLSASALGPHLHTSFEPILEQMFTVEFEKPLVDTLSKVAFHIPGLKQYIQKQLLEKVTQILKSTEGEEEILKSFNTLVWKVPTTENTDKLSLGLETLATFDFGQLELREVVQEHVIPYLSYDNPAIRRKSILACTKLLVNGEVPPVNSPATEIIVSAIRKLFSVAMTDPDDSIRVTVLTSFVPSYDRYLVQPDFLKKLFLFLNDSLSQVQELAIILLGRLSQYNPAYIHPILRSTFMKYLKALDYADLAHKERCVTLFSLIVRSVPKLIQPYTGPIVNIILQKLRSKESQILSSNCLAVIGDISSVAGKEMRKYFDELFPLVIESFEDPNSSHKRKIALKTLGELIESTGYVIKPLLMNPKLLDMIFAKIKRTGSIKVAVLLVRLLGIIGAIDPYRHKTLQLELLEKDNSESAKQNPKAEQNYLQFKDFIRSIPPQSTEYYPSMTLDMLMKFLKNPYDNLANLQTTVIQACMTIFRSMGLKCVAYLKYFMPVLKDVMDICSAPGLREMLIQQFCILVATIQHFTKDYLDLIMQIMEQYWDYESLQDKIVGLLEEISRVLIDEFTPCLHKFLPKMLSVLKNKGTHSGPIMHALRVFGTAVDPYLYTIVPAIVGLFDSANSYQAILCIGHMTYIHDLSPYLLLIYQPLLVAIKSPVPEIQNTALRTCTDLFSTVEESSPFVDPLLAFLEKSAIVCPHLEETLSRLKNKQAIPREVPMEYSTHRGLDSEDLLPFETNHPRSFKSNHEILGTAWDTTWCSTKADWTEWFRKLSITMLKESPSPALRCCSGLATNYQPVALELFNPGFVSCWDSLTEEFQKTTVEYIDKAISSPTIPNEELHYLLDLAEFMERSEKTQKYTLEINKLAHLAEKICAYAKALYYREKEFKQNPSQKIVGQIISLNDALGQHEAAQGMFRYNKEKFKTKLDITLYEKLQRWIKVLKRYEELQKQKPNDLSIILGRMRCLQNLGQWEDVVALAEKALSFPSSSSNGELALFAKRASLNLGRWDDLEKYINIDKKEIDGGFYHAVLLVHRNDFGNAKKVIDMCRETAVNDLMALVGESYRRAYDVVVRIQQLTELEEVITYKTSSQERKEMIKTLWENRLAGVERNVEVWQNILSVRSLVLPPQSNPEIWVKFSNLSRKNMRFKRAEIILTQLLLGDSKLTQTASIDPKVKYVYINLLWQKDQKEEAFSNMKEWVADFPRLNVPPSRQARCYVKLAQWQLYLNDSSLNETVIPSMIQSCKLAIELDGDWHKAWHTWAIINYRVLGHYLKESESNIDPYLLHALTGFIRAISLAPTENIQDTLRLLTLWFSYGHKRIVEISIREGFDIINPDTWLSVIPQIIARIHNPLRTVKNGIQQLLINLGKRHPQALVFPITVAQRSPFKQRVTASKSIINAIRQFNPKLIQETEIVSEELIRIAILWKEKWFKGLEEASHFYYVERQESKMMAVLQPLHEMLRNGPVTQHEKAVAKAFGRDLEKAWDCCKEYSKTRKESSMNLAWDLYAHVYRIIKRHLQTEFDKLHLSNISPELMKIKDLDLAVPGTYMKTFKAGKSVISITSFAQVLKVIPSKQKPRKTIIHGSDGNEYPFLLKGNEDLRQDERVMQLFSLVNNLLESDDITSKNHLSIQRYSVIPLCSDSGLIEWLPHSDTLHELLTVYRKAHSIPIDAELTLMQRFCMKNEYFKLPLIKKLEVFEFALDNTHGEGDDLERILWLNSPNAESWLDKRTTYTRSLAVMSMVGYILGLGDRHPNNLMLNRNSGKVIHIDFGDCFEVAMLRERFAELVPFRLTRMLINALEVSGIRGTFRATCETVMRVLRDNKESMLAVLEAFVYDPLINWRLTKNPGAPSNYNGDDDEVDALLVDKQKGYSGVSTGMTGSGTTTVSNASGLTLPQYSESSEDFLYSDENSLDEEGYDHGKFEHRALKIIERVSYKLSGRDFPGQTLSVEKQVDLLIKQATSHELLCQAYLGWCPYW